MIFDNRRNYTVGKEVNVHFTTRSSELSLLKVNILGPSKCAIKHYKLREGLYGVSFVPLLPGSYMMIIKWDGVEVLGSPAICNVAEHEQVFQRRPSLSKPSLKPEEKMKK